jgi:hypothetical protein
MKYIIILIVIILIIIYLLFNQQNIEHMTGVNTTYDLNNNPYYNDDIIQHNYSFSRKKNGLGNIKGMQPKYIHENESTDYIKPIDQLDNSKNIDPLYKKNIIKTNDKLFLTNDNSNTIPLFLTNNSYNIYKGLQNNIIIDTII